MCFQASLPFIAFVVWLLAVPMEGFLVTPLGVQHPLLFFLIPQIITLWCIGSVRSRTFMAPLSVAGGGITIGATVLLPHVPGTASLLLGLAGVGSAFLCVRACCYLKRSPSLVTTAALGLAGANVLLFLFTVVPLADSVKFLLAAALLLIPLVADFEIRTDDGNENLPLFLPFVFVFQLVSGLMYGALYGHYARVALFPGIELIFYILAVGSGLAVLRRRHEGLLAIAIVTAMFAFSLYLIPGTVPVNAALFAMQTAAGFLDLYLLALLLSQRDTVRAFGRGLAVACSGIVLGKIIALAVRDVPPLVVAASNLVLTVSILLLYRQMRGEQNLAGQPSAADTETKTLDEAKIAQPEPLARLTLPPGLNKRFSDQEKSVLACIVQGMTFKEAARCLTISESSVKTYMKRIYEKTSVAGKEELLAKLGGGWGETDCERELLHDRSAP
ncbi:LuxR family transcriptional regulator [Trichlorobacter ammonificans]|uniref:Regulatory protein n=1 Tax=Trichlorobacter ammonificans TaxID=2916410 RepID=A0ABM9DAG0_9BACT|nr:LuxR C-terminal-related transcriptional regulator [Trichlorobacter ammonificans]CAH2031618.1 Regulatory protein [Trichlorobacter ammonificans]